MNTRYFSLAIGLLLLGVAFAAHAEGPDTPPANRLITPGKRIVLLGVFGGAGLVQHSGPFSTTDQGLPCCTYDDGSGMAFLGGVKMAIPLADRLYLLPRGAYHTMDGEFDSAPFSYPILGADNEMEDADFENRLKVTLSSALFGVHAAYIFTPFGMYASAGPSMSYVLSKEFTSTDRLTGPPGVVFLSGGTEKEVYRGDIAITQSAYFAFDVALGIMLEVSTTVFVNPEVQYRLPITSLAKGQDWMPGGVYGSIGVMLGL